MGRLRGPRVGHQWRLPRNRGRAAVLATVVLRLAGPPLRLSAAGRRGLHRRVVRHPAHARALHRHRGSRPEVRDGHEVSGWADGPLEALHESVGGPRSRGAVGARRSLRLLSLRDTARAMSQEKVEITTLKASKAFA